MDSDWSPERPAAALPAPEQGWRQLLRRKGIDRVQVAIVLTASLLAVAFCATLAYFMTANQHSVTERVRVQNQNLAHAFKLHATAAFDLVDHTLKSGRHQWIEARELRDQWALGETLPNFKKMIVQVAIIDAHGRLAASSIDPRVNPIYLGDREHFKVHLGSQADRLFVGKPLIGRVSGRPSVQFSRPVFDAAGAFAGVVVASVDPGFIGDFFTGLRTDGGASYGLIGDDGVPRVWVGSQRVALQEARRSPLLRVSEQGKLSGVFEAPGSALLDGASWHLESLDNAPLVVAVSTDSDVPRGQLRALHLAAWVLGGLFVAFTAAAATYLVLAVRRNNDIVRQLHESQRHANSANEMKSRFLASVSHELRTPLNGILGFSELVAMTTDAAQAANYGQLIHKRARHLHELVNTMLDLAKIEAGRMEVTRSLCDPKEICEAVGGMHRLAAEKKGLALRIDYAPDLPTAIHTDRIKLIQILSKLLHNAVKFTLEGQVSLEVGLRGEDWLFSVTDTGVGMTSEQVAGLFDRFRHSEFHMAAVAREQGSGLGMALCKELVELLGGHIAVRSAPAQGTTMEVVLPVSGARA